MTTMHMRREVPRHDDEALCGAKVDDNLVTSRDLITCWKCVHLVLGRPLPPEPETPEHDRLKEAKHKSGDATQLLGDFVTWMREEKRYRLCTYNQGDGEFYEINASTQTLIAAFFGINEAALSAEKDALLEYQRAFNKAIDWTNNEGKPHLQKHP